MLKTIRNTFCIMLTSILLISAFPAHSAKLYIFVVNKCGPHDPLIMQLQRLKWGVNHKYCGHRMWPDTKRVHYGQAHVFGPKHIYQGCKYRIHWKRTGITQHKEHQVTITIKENRAHYYVIFGHRRCRK